MTMTIQAWNIVLNAVVVVTVFNRTMKREEREARRA